ncbi:MAG TPA: MFS transporter [Dehalococcoidia bacterium]|nr:MFS transporter [Dehalococcoidia bacterium]
MTQAGTSTNTAATRWLSLGVLCAGMLMIVLDQTIVNVALPSIQSNLGFSQSSLAWVVNAYLIAFGGLLLLAGRLGDLVGRKSVFLLGLGVFTGASLICGLSRSQWMLIGARFVQGVGGATTSAVILGMIVTMFPGPREKAKAIGVYSFVASAGASIGLLVGGVLTQAFNWHWIFFVNVPIGIVAGILTMRLLDPDVGAGLRGGADAAGAVLVTLGLMLGVYTIVETTDYSWSSMHTVVTGTLAIALLAGFLVRQAMAAKPLVPLGIFRSRSLSGANVIQALTVAGMIGMFFLSSLYMERVLGYSPLQLGLAFLPASLGIGALSLGLAPRLAMRFGARPILLAGLAAALLGLALLTRTPVDGRYVRDILPAMLLMGVGIGIMFPPLMMLAMADVSPIDTGLASGLVNTSAEVGGALGLAVLATLATSRTHALLTAGNGVAAALTGGYQLAFLISAGLFVAAIAVGFAVLQSETQTPQQPGLEIEPAVAHVA